MSFAIRRALRGLVIAGCLCAGTFGASTVIAAPSALAVSGDYCQATSLAPGETCTHLVLHYFIETEGWSKGGTGNCNGVESGGSWVGYSCDGDSSPPDEVYCTSACDGQSGYAFIHDHSAYSSDVFTGWLDASQ
jgi:hypothetical protein